MKVNKKEEPESHCSFCGRFSDFTKMLLEGIEGNICYDCILVAFNQVKEWDLKYPKDKDAEEKD